jgi:hypothetical protein
LNSRHFACNNNKKEKSNMIETTETNENTGTIDLTDEAPEKETRTKRVTNDYDSKPGLLLMTVEGFDGPALEFDPSELPADYFKKLPAMAIAVKLGNIVAREKEPAAAVAAVSVAWEDMKTGVFQTKKSADKVKVSKSQLLAKLDALSPKERAIAEKILAGILR